MEPFYFKSYDKIIGVAWDVKDLNTQMKRLSQEDPKALEYHLEQGHIVQWLEYINDRELARDLRGVKTIEQGLYVVEKYLEESAIMYRVRRGRMC